MRFRGGGGGSGRVMAVGCWPGSRRLAGARGLARGFSHIAPVTVPGPWGREKGRGGSWNLFGGRSLEAIAEGVV